MRVRNFPAMPFHPSVQEWDADLLAGDPLGFPGYDERRRALAKTGEAVATGRTEHYAYIEGRFDVLGGSMGVAVGERVVRAYDRARDLGLPVVVATRSGGARMQEGMVALVQLARTASAASRHARAGLLSLAVYGSPTTGGVYASYASLVDLRAAVEHAVIGFAGPRRGRGRPRRAVAAGLAHRRGGPRRGPGRRRAARPPPSAAWVEAALGLTTSPCPPVRCPPGPTRGTTGAWGEVLRARAVGRPTGIDRAARLCSSWTELRGPDAVVRAGLATVAGTPVRGGRHRPVPPGRPADARRVPPGPAGGRLAGRLGLPVVTLVDTPGADPSAASEDDGLAARDRPDVAALAECPTPVVSVCVGEGGSGGALALSYADRLLMSEHAVFSVIGPEGAAAILERDPTQGPKVAGWLGLTSADLLRLGVIDEVVAEGQDALDAAVAEALDSAVVGQREARFDRMTARWIEPVGD